MADLRFTWDAKKASQNELKHGIGFEEAQSVFYDEHALQLEDPDAPEGEERFSDARLEWRSPCSRGLPLCSRSWRRGSDHLGQKGVKAEQKQYWERLKR